MKHRPRGVPGPTEHAGHTHEVPHGGQQAVAQAPPVSGTITAAGHGEPHESPWVMVLPLVLLAVLSIVGGYVGVPKGAAWQQ